MINFKLIKNYKQSFLGVLAVSSITKIFSFSEFFFLRKSFNILEENLEGSYFQFALFFLLSFGSRAISLIFSWAFAVAQQHGILKTKRSIGSQILVEVAKSKLSYFKTLNREGKIFSTIDNDLSNYVSNKVQFITFYIFNIGTLIVTTIFLIYNNWLFGLIVVITFLII